MKQMEVMIMGQTYLLVCPDGGEERLQLAVQRVDREMCSIRDAGKVKARERIAVLAALNLAFGHDATRAEVPADSLTGATVPAAASAAAVPNDAVGPDVAELVHRIDRVLQDDGQLI